MEVVWLQGTDDEGTRGKGPHTWFGIIKEVKGPLKHFFTNSPPIDILGENKGRETGRRPAIQKGTRKPRTSKDVVTLDLRTVWLAVADAYPNRNWLSSVEPPL